MSRRARRSREDERPLFTDPDEIPLRSEYRSMWLFALFDLPVVSKAQKRRAAGFRKDLIKRGFTMLQFSVYARHCANEEAAIALRTQVRGFLPPDGQVRLIGITDRQFGRMEVFSGRKRTPTEDPPAQLMLF